MLISGKAHVNKETDFLKSQLNANHIFVSALTSPHITVNDSIIGGFSYSGFKLKYILIPREESIKFKEIHLLVSSLKAIQDKKASLSSNRGSCHKVYFEYKDSNYVDLGIGVSRFSPGLYKKRIKGVHDSDIGNVERYFKFVQGLVKKYIPQSLLNVLNVALNEVDLEDMSQIKGYKEMKKQNVEYLSQNTSTEENVFKVYDFMPSASYGCNNLLPLHTDEDMFLSIIHVHAASDVIKRHDSSYYKLKADISKYFTFDDGSSVGMRSGDILVFNPTISHCVSSNTDRYAKDEVFCVSHYFKSLIAGRNNNKIKFGN